MIYKLSPGVNINKWSRKGTLTFDLLNSNNRRWHFKTFFLFFTENKTVQCIQIVSKGDHLNTYQVLFSERRQFECSVRSYFLKGVIWMQCQVLFSERRQFECSVRSYFLKGDIWMQCQVLFSEQKKKKTISCIFRLQPLPTVC